MSCPVQDRENLEYLDAVLDTVSHGLQALMELLADSPDDKMIGAANLRTLIGPLADEARQAAPLPGMLLGV